MSRPKLLTFLGDSRLSLKLFPFEARKRAGRQLDLVQRGEEPLDWKPMNSVGSGVREIRIRGETGIYRVIYVTKIADKVFVLHCFHKKTQRTAAADIELAKRRYKDLIKDYSR